LKPNDVARNMTTLLDYYFVFPQKLVHKRIIIIKINVGHKFYEEIIIKIITINNHMIITIIYMHIDIRIPNIFYKY